MDVKDTRTLAYRVKSLRKSRGLTLEDLGEMIGSNKSQVWAIEDQPNIRPTANTVLKLSRALGTTMEHLMGEEPRSDAHTRVLLNKYDALSDDNKLRLMRIIEVL